MPEQDAILFWNLSKAIDNHLDYVSEMAKSYRKKDYKSNENRFQK